MPSVKLAPVSNRKSKSRMMIRGLMREKKVSQQRIADDLKKYLVTDKSRQAVSSNIENMNMTYPELIVMFKTLELSDQQILAIMKLER